jgi:Fur family ferric uptake transcriptional regulator
MSRKTAQREAIQRAFEYEDRPLRPEEILFIGRQWVDSLNQATVYRGITLLLEQGWLKKVEHPGASAAYERANKPHHHHFLCRLCARLLDIPGECQFHHDHALPEGFLGETHEILVHGVCANCSQSKAEKSARLRGNRGM